MTSQLQAPLAFGAAQAYLESIEPAYERIRLRVKARESGGNDLIVGSPGEIAPVVSGISFALELFIKVLHMQDFGSASRGHDLPVLWMKLSEATRSRIEARYPSSVLSWTNQNELPFVLVNTTEGYVDIEPAPLSTCEEAMERIGRAFEQWRYMYELMKPGGGYLYFNFAEAFGAVDALRAEILNYPGNTLVVMSRNARAQ